MKSFRHHMKTPAYENFLVQFNKTGSEKADGYSLGAFEGLTSGERARVFEMLESELPFSTEWLFHLDADKATLVAEAEEGRLRGSSHSHVFILQEFLVRYTGNLAYQARMIDDFARYVDRLKPLVVDAVARTPINDATLEFFRKVIMAGNQASAVARAARHFLSAKNIQGDTEADREQYVKLMHDLTSEDPGRKFRAIARVEGEPSLTSSTYHSRSHDR